jgi:hypothetical protein
MVKVPKKVSDRLSKQVKIFQRVLQKAKDRDVNESDTVTIITDMLSSVFGYDKYSEITSEQAIRGTFCDLAIKVKGTIKFLIEVKAIGLTLKENHLRQAINYGANQGISWVVLTNGISWQIHKLGFERPISCELVCAFDFLELSARKAEDQSKLFLLCKGGLSKAVMEQYLEHVQIVNRFVVAALIQTEPVLNVVRRELKRLSPGLKPNKDEIAGIIASEVLKRDVVEGDAAQDAAKQVKRAAKKAIRKRAPKTAPPVE